MTEMFRVLGLVASLATLLILAAIRHLSSGSVPEGRTPVQWDVHGHPSGLADEPVSPGVPVTVFLFVATAMSARRDARRSPPGRVSATSRPSVR
jgi:ribose/xylose/arabinose/galactoside ABC-type transport system permease subunit